MKASELIKELQKYIEEYEDCEVGFDLPGVHNVVDVLVVRGVGARTGYRITTKYRKQDYLLGFEKGMMADGDEYIIVLR